LILSTLINVAGRNLDEVVLEKQTKAEEPKETQVEPPVIEPAPKQEQEVRPLTEIPTETVEPKPTEPEPTIETKPIEPEPVAITESAPTITPTEPVAITESESKPTEPELEPTPTPTEPVAITEPEPKPTEAEPTIEPKSIEPEPVSITEPEPTQEQEIPEREPEQEVPVQEEEEEVKDWPDEPEVPEEIAEFVQENDELNYLLYDPLKNSKRALLQAWSNYFLLKASHQPILNWSEGAKVSKFCYCESGLMNASQDLKVYLLLLQHLQPDVFESASHLMQEPLEKRATALVRALDEIGVNDFTAKELIKVCSYRAISSPITFCF
jgi:hypothetical protein